MKKISKKSSTLFIVLIFIVALLLNGELDLFSPVNVTDTTGTLRVHFIDVGQGDAILVQTPSGQNMLVDAGENSRGHEVVDYLRSQGVRQLDIVVGTHPHSDHIGGLDTVINRFPPEKVYLPKATNNTKSFRDVLTAVKDQGLKVTTAKAGVDLHLEGVKARFVAPVADSYESLNNYSAVIILNYGSYTFLLTGDAEELSEAQILASGADIKCTVLKAGHHGSATSTSPEFLQAAAPDYAVIMLGEDNPYNHPHAEILEKLSEAGIEIYRTDQNGTIVFTTDGDEMKISKER